MKNSQRLKAAKASQQQQLSQKDEESCPLDGTDLDSLPLLTKKKRRPPAQWVSLGSEKEVDDERCQSTRPLVS